jgi:hypothetical protein
MAYQYFLDRVSHPVRKADLQKMLGEEFAMIEDASKGFKHIYEYSTIVHTTHGDVIVHNVTLPRAMNIAFGLLAMLILIAALIFKMQNWNSIHISHAFIGIGALALLASIVIYVLGFKNDERRFIDIASPITLCGFVALLTALICR